MSRSSLDSALRTKGEHTSRPSPSGTSAGWGFRSTGKRANSPLCRGSLFSAGVGLGQPHSTSLRGACSVNAEMPGVSPAQEGGSTETFSEAPGAYGILSRYHAARIASYETASALASRPSPEMGMAPRHIPGLTHPVLPSHLQPMVGSCLSSGRSSPRASIQARCCFNRRLCHGLGGHVQRARSRGALDRAPAAVAYQLPRVAGSIACSAPLQNAATREAYTGPFGQHCDRCVHQPPGRSTLPSHVATRPPSPPLESEASEVASRRSCPRRAQSCSRRALTSARPSGRMATPPRGTPADWRRFGDAQVDLFASPDTSHCQLFFSLSEGTLGTDALACSWPRGLRKYAFPPVSLLAQTLCKVREDEEQVLLVRLTGPIGRGSQNWCSSRQPLLGKFLWGGIYFLREGAPSGTRAQTCGISTYGPWTGRGGSKWATSSGSKHYHFCQGSVYETSLQAEVEPVRRLVFSPPGGPP